MQNIEGARQQTTPNLSIAEVVPEGVRIQPQGTFEEDISDESMVVMRLIAEALQHKSPYNNDHFFKLTDEALKTGGAGGAVFLLFTLQELLKPTMDCTREYLDDRKQGPFFRITHYLLMICGQGESLTEIDKTPIVQIHPREARKILKYLKAIALDLEVSKDARIGIRGAFSDSYHNRSFLGKLEGFFLDQVLSRIAPQYTLAIMFLFEDIKWIRGKDKFLHTLKFEENQSKWENLVANATKTNDSEL